MAKEYTNNSKDKQYQDIKDILKKPDLKDLDIKDYLIFVLQILLIKIMVESIFRRCL